jgi:thiosulfate dehydrogenase (quinone) large subunit
MQNTAVSRFLIIYFRLAMGWTFLYAGVTQLAEPNFTAATFLAHTKTFHDFFAWFSSPALIPYTDFLVKWGHTLIGLSLVTGCLVRISAPFGVLLMLVYYLAHLDFPYVDSHVNFITEYHLVYAGVLVYLIAARAGHVWGLDGWTQRLPLITERQYLRPLIG